MLGTGYADGLMLAEAVSGVRLSNTVTTNNSTTWIVKKMRFDNRGAVLT